MIVSHQHKFIFFAVPKTATHAIRTVLNECLGAKDWQQQQLFGKTELPIPELASIGHGHITVQEAQRYLPSDVWRNYYKFASYVVRNPFDRFVSVCAFLNRDNPSFEGTAKLWMKTALDRPRFLQRVLVRPQCDMLKDSKGRLVLDAIGRYETLQASIDQIVAQLNLPGVALSKRNASKHKSFYTYYDEELKDKVRQIYHQDFELFGYPN